MMKRHGLSLLSVLLIVVFFVCSANPALALSFRLYDAGAKAQGQAGAFTAQASDASAVYYNPAALTDQEKGEFLTGLELLYLETDYTGAGGVAESSDNDWKPVPHTYAAVRLNDRLVTGLGIYSLFGLATEYSDRGSFRYVATSSELKTVSFSPVLAYEVNQQLSVAAGLDVMVGELDLRRKVDFGALAGFPGSADGDFRIDADGEAVGFNLSVLFQPHWRHRLGLMFRSPVELEMDGSSNIANIPGFLGVGPSSTGPLSTELDLPSVLRFGYAFYPNKRWKIEFDLDWTNFSSFRNLAFESGNPLFPSTLVPQNLDDSYVYALGTEYVTSRGWRLRTGYARVIGATPNETFNPLVPDSDRNIFTVGFGFFLGAIEIDFAYQFILFDERDVDNNVGADVGSTVDGEYESIVHGIACDVRLPF